MKTKTILSIASVFIAISGVLLIEHYNQISIGVLLLMWSNNISRTQRDK